MQYSGELLDGRMHGRGCLQYPSGVKYDGQFLHGKREGEESV